MRMRIDNGPIGLSFLQWQAAIIEATEDVCDWVHDIIEREQLEYLDLLWEWSKEEKPPIIRRARGLGNWKDPKVVFMTNPKYKPKYGNPYWEEDPRYKFIHAMGKSQVLINAYLHLFINSEHYHPSKIYITSQEKPWLMDTEENYQLLQFEISSFKNAKWIIEAPFTYEELLEEYTLINGDRDKNKLIFNAALRS